MKTQSNTNKLPLYEKIGYAMGDAGGNLVWRGALAYLAVFYTDTFGISAAAAAIPVGAAAAAPQRSAALLDASRPAAGASPYAASSAGRLPIHALRRAAIRHTPKARLQRAWPAGQLRRALAEVVHNRHAKGELRRCRGRRPRASADVADGRGGRSLRGGRVV